MGTIFITSKNLVVKSMFPHQNIHKHTWISPDGKPHYQINLHLVIKSRMNRWDTARMGERKGAYRILVAKPE
jgi:hypothetical protein